MRLDGLVPSETPRAALKWGSSNPVVFMSSAAFAGHFVHRFAFRAAQCVLAYWVMAALLGDASQMPSRFDLAWSGALALFVLCLPRPARPRRGDQARAASGYGVRFRAPHFPA